jgi:hypothetical protein
MCYEERQTIEHMWNEWSEMREREGKERRGEILNEDRRIYERDMEEEGKDREGEGWGIGIRKLVGQNKELGTSGVKLSEHPLN